MLHSYWSNLNFFVLPMQPPIVSTSLLAVNGWTERKFNQVHHRDSRVTRPALILDPVTMQIVAVGIEPALGALDVIAGAPDHAPEPRRVVHLDEVRHFMRGEIVQHEGRREDQPP